MSVFPFARAAAQVRAQPSPWRLAVRQMPALLLAGGLVFLLWGRVDEVDPRAVLQALGALAPWQWAAAAGLTALSFWAIGRYDALVHQHLATGCDPREAGRAGLLAIALGQTAGFGVLTGTLVRWRMLPSVTLARALQITLSVSVLFLIGWGFVSLIAFLLLPVPPALRALAWAGLIVLPVFAGLCLWQPRITVFGRDIRLPNAMTLTRLVGLTAIDMLAAGLCLAVLMPPEAGVSVAVLLPVFLIAFGAGMLSGAPGGMGAFEVTLLAMLPFAATAPVLAGIVAWRVVYYAVPALIALVFLARGPLPDRPSTTTPMALEVGRPLPARLEAAIYRAGRAEAGLLRQGDKAFLPLDGAAEGAVLGRTGHILAMIGDPFGPDRDGAGLVGLHEAARAEGRLPVLYKVNVRLAAQARHAGWAVAPLAMEGWLRPAEFQLDVPARRQLRRKIRKAEAAGVTLAEWHGAPTAQMARIAADWAAHRGGERGFSMGRYSPDYVQSQRVFLAHAEEHLVGFLTLHEARSEWTLDLMRAGADAPDGTMHALLAHAIGQAGRESVPRLSLAALPHRWLGDLTAKLPAPLGRAVEVPGLAQFKHGFAPHWEVLYAAAPSRAGLALAAWDIARAIRWPGPLPAPRPTDRRERPQQRQAA